MKEQMFENGDILELFRYFRKKTGKKIDFSDIKCYTVLAWSKME